jgi:chromosome segregation ATPase
MREILSYQQTAQKLRADLARALTAYDESHAEHRAEVTRLFNEMSQLRADLAHVTEERDKALLANLPLHADRATLIDSLAAARAETERLSERVEKAYEQLERSGDYIAFRARIKAALTSDPEPTT